MSPSPERRAPPELGRAAAAGATLGAMLVLSACGSLLESDAPPRRVYWLEPAAVSVAGNWRAPDGQLTVEVRAAPGLDTDRILLLEADQRLHYFAGAHWPDRLPAVMAGLVRQSLSVPVGAGAAPAPPIRLELRRFFVEGRTAARPGRAVISARVRIGEGPPFSLDVEEEIESERLGSTVAAFQEAVVRLLRMLAREAAEQSSAAA